MEVERIEAERAKQRLSAQGVHSEGFESPSLSSNELTLDKSGQAWDFAARKIGLTTSILGPLFSL